MQSIQLKQFPSAREVLEAISNADQTFRKEFKRAPKTDLVYSESGDTKRPRFFVAAWVENDKTELTWYKKHFGVN